MRPVESTDVREYYALHDCYWTRILLFVLNVYFVHWNLKCLEFRTPPLPSFFSRLGKIVFSETFPFLPPLQRKSHVQCTRQPAQKIYNLARRKRESFVRDVSTPRLLVWKRISEFRGKRLRNPLFFIHASDGSFDLLSPLTCLTCIGAEIVRNRAIGRLGQWQVASVFIIF